MEYKYILSQIVKLIFLDKYINRIFGRDLGIIRLNDNYIVDIPKSGSTTIKHLIAKRSKRYNFCKKYLKIKPKHPSVRPIKEIKPVNGEIKIFVFLRPPEERLYSLYNQKVLNYKTFPLGFSIIKKEKFYLTKRFISNTKYNKDNTFLEFCEGITELKSEFLNKGYELDLFDKHLSAE